MTVNSLNTNIDEIRKELSIDEFDEFYKMLTEVPFIQYLVSPDRKRACDCEKYSDGRIKVDFEHPHILENMSYFTEARDNFLKTGKYCPYEKSTNKTSPYGQWWLREVNRCRNGMVREDGEWIPGILYFYWNYVRIMLTEIVENKELGTKKGRKVESFPDIWATSYYRAHYLILAREYGNHAMELARRGAGKSYTLAAIMAHHFLFGEDEVARQRIYTMVVASNKEFLADKDGTLSKFKPMLNWCAKHTEFPHLMLKESPSDMIWIAGYRDKNKSIRGSQNCVLGVPSKDIENIRGKRGWILIEEMGKFKGLEDMYHIIRPGVEDGDITTAMVYMVGTSTPKGSNFEDAKKLISSASEENIFTIKNTFEPIGTCRLDRFVFFVPSYLNRLDCYDKDGNTDITKALAQVCKARVKARLSGNPKKYLASLTEFPILPSDAMLNAEEAFFPVSSLMNRLNEIDSNPFSLNDILCGTLSEDSMGNVTFKNGGIPIRSYPLGSQKKEGCVEILAMPQKDANGEVFNNRYIIGHDPVDNDKAVSSSLSSTIVFDTITDSIVAEYTGRHSHARENYHVCLLLCKFYNAKCLYESNKKGLYAYFSQMCATKYLADTPKYLRDRDLVNYEAFGSNTKGVNALDKVNDFADERILDWLTSPVYIDTSDEPIMRLNTLRSRALIQELIAYSPNVNVDRVRALGMVMLLREAYIIRTNQKKQSDKNASNSKRLDSFFEINYRRN